MVCTNREHTDRRGGRPRVPVPAAEVQTVTAEQAENAVVARAETAAAAAGMMEVPLAEDTASGVDPAAPIDVVRAAHVPIDRVMSFDTSRNRVNASPVNTRVASRANTRNDSLVIAPKAVGSTARIASCGSICSGRAPLLMPRRLDREWPSDSVRSASALSTTC